MELHLKPKAVSDVVTRNVQHSHNVLAVTLSVSFWTVLILTYFLSRKSHFVQFASSFNKAVSSLRKRLREYMKVADILSICFNLKSSAHNY